MVKSLILLFLLAGCATIPKIHDIPNLSQITPNVYRSSQPITVEQWGYIAKLGVKFVVKLNCDNEGNGRDDLNAQYAGLIVYRICLHPRTDAGEPIGALIELFRGPSDEELEALDWLAQYIAAEDPPVLIHCVNGRERTGLLAGMIVRYRYGWSREQAYAYMLKTGFRPQAIGIARAWVRWNLKFFVDKSSK